MTKKKILPIIIAALIVVGLVLFGKNVPIYPAFQKNVNTFDKVEAELNENVVFPKIDEEIGTETSYKIILDGRTIEAKPIGYVIESVKTNNEAEERFSYVGKEGKSEEQKSYKHEYRSVNIGVAYGKDAVMPTRSCCVTIQFSYCGMTYELKGLYTRNMEIERTNDKQAEENQAKIEQMQDYLLKQCYEMIDEALEK